RPRHARARRRRRTHRERKRPHGRLHLARRRAARRGCRSTAVALALKRGGMAGRVAVFENSDTFDWFVAGSDIFLSSVAQLCFRHQIGPDWPPGRLCNELFMLPPTTEPVTVLRYSRRASVELRLN